MSSKLFEEAIADAKKLREVAEDNAKKAILEAVTPRIREFIEAQLLENDDDTNEAESETADYSLTNNTLVMSGNVLLKRGQNAISAETMNVDLATGSAVLMGRVRTVLKTDSN